MSKRTLSEPASSAKLPSRDICLPSPFSRCRYATPPSVCNNRIQKDQFIAPNTVLSVSGQQHEQRKGSMNSLVGTQHNNNDLATNQPTLSCTLYQLRGQSFIQFIDELALFGLIMVQRHTPRKTNTRCRLSYSRTRTVLVLFSKVEQKNSVPYVPRGFSHRSSADQRQQRTAADHTQGQC